MSQDDTRIYRSGLVLDPWTDAPSERSGAVIGPIAVTLPDGFVWSDDGTAIPTDRGSTQP